jgi:putative spermidine/putrescine transport system permease protein/spermidine/putrescine transport system permease protein
MPLVFLLMSAVFRMQDPRLVDAALDLGARPWRCFFEVVVPIAETGIVSSALIAFVISLNEFVMTLLLTGRDNQTLPVLMWLSLRSAAAPGLAVASVILSLTVVAILNVTYLANRKGKLI